MIPFEFEVKYDEDSGFRGLRQIWDSLNASTNPYVREIYSKHVDHYMRRCFPATNGLILVYGKKGELDEIRMIEEVDEELWGKKVGNAERKLGMIE